MTDYALAPIPRSAWGAVHEDGTGDRPLPVKEFWLHHSVTIAPDLLPPFSDDDDAIRTLERIGEERFGRGISYTYPVTPVGRLYVGHSLDRVGSHTRGHNTVGAAFCLVGDYSTRKPTAAQVEVIARRMVVLHRQGKATRHTLNGGHTQARLPEGGTAATACPGGAGLAAVPVINARADALWAAGYPTTGKDPLVDHETFKRLVREVMAERETARKLWTGHRIVVDPTKATRTEVTPSNLLERIARKVGIQ